MQIPLTILPPKNWQDFESLTLELAKAKLQLDFTFYGRWGQKQDGIDLLGRDEFNNYTAIQCKSINPTTLEYKFISKLTQGLLEKWIAKSSEYSSPLKKFIIATTSLTDKKIQDYIINLNKVRFNKGESIIEVWFWETFEQEINNHVHLMYYYYDKLLSNSQYYNKDKHIVAFLYYSFNRPAYYTLFGSENDCDDFIKAIADTQKAITTGKLFDRDDMVLRTSFSAHELSKKSDKEIVYKILKKLQKIRDFITEQKKLDNFVQSSKDFFHIRNDYENNITKNLNEWRAEVLEMFNKLAKKHGIDLIKSILLDKNYRGKYYN